MITEIPSVGNKYTYLLKVNPAIISASSMSPKNCVVEVVAIRDPDIWYRIDDDPKVKTTSIERFMTIVDDLIFEKKETTIVDAFVNILRQGSLYG